MKAENVLSWEGRSRRTRKPPPKTYWEEYVATDEWYLKKLVEDIPASELDAALYDENFDDDLGEEGEESEEEDEEEEEDTTEEDEGEESDIILDDEMDYEPRQSSSSTSDSSSITSEHSADEED